MSRFYRLARNIAFKRIVPYLAILLASTALNGEIAWKTVRDKAGACQISVPPNWTLLSIPGYVNLPQSATTIVTSGHRQYRPFSPETFRVLKIETVFENSTKRAFGMSKPSGSSSLVSYHVETSGKMNSCIAEIAIPQNASDEEAKTIALSLSKIP